MDLYVSAQAVYKRRPHAQLVGLERPVLIGKLFNKHVHAVVVFAHRFSPFLFEVFP